MEKNKLVTYLRGLFYIQLAGCLLSALALLSSLLHFSVGEWFSWAQKAVTLGAAICLLFLNGRYQLSGFAKAAAFVCGLLPLFLHNLMHMDVQQYVSVNRILGRIALLFSMTAMVLEYSGHAATIPADKRKWNVLLIGSVTFTVLTTVAVDMLQNVMDKVIQNGIPWYITLYNLLAQSLSLAVGILYLFLLNRVISHIKQTMHESD